MNPLRTEVSDLIPPLRELQTRMRQLEAEHEARIVALPLERQASARNLLHYLALRRHDVRELQEALVGWGLSSLGRSESHVLDNVQAVYRHVLREADAEEEALPSPPLDYAGGREHLDRATTDLFGKAPEDHPAHIMVTMPTEAAEDPALVRRLVEQGMDCMRINCAHDDPTDWAAMIANLREAEAATGRSCRVMMDLAGPKIRTGPLAAGPAVLKWRPRRDAHGRVTAPAKVWLYAQGPGEPPVKPGMTSLPIEGDGLEHLNEGDDLQFHDTRGRLRWLRVIERSETGAVAVSQRTVYLTSGTPLYRVVFGHGHSEATDAPPTARVGSVSPLEQTLSLGVGDRLVLSGDGEPGSPARYDENGVLEAPARIACTLPQIFAHVRAGERVLFDDGRIEGEIEIADPDHLVVRVLRAGVRGSRLGADKGINFPDSRLELGALTAKDVDDLEFVARHADAVSYSFVRLPEDVDRLLAELDRLDRPDMGIIVKIENRQATERLPSILLELLRSPAAGVMIARGDLAVECGWERLAELQEEILWMAEAAHLPVVWATQVLEGLAKKGIPTRAEVTDAAMAVRAECVMLNKGPHILDALEALSDILRRMHDHQVKKRPMLRRLRLADDLT